VDCSAAKAPPALNGANPSGSLRGDLAAEFPFGYAPGDQGSTDDPPAGWRIRGRARRLGRRRPPHNPRLATQQNAFDDISRAQASPKGMTDPKNELDGRAGGDHSSVR